MLEVDFPLLFRVQVVKDPLDVDVLADGLAEGEARTGHEDFSAALAQYRDGVVQGAGGSERENHVVRVNRVLLSAELLCDCLTRLHSTACLRISIV